jgi:Mrp family chromosome partitioning ATPase
VTTNLAVSLALKGYHVGGCDMDSHSANIPKTNGDDKNH